MALDKIVIVRLKRNSAGGAYVSVIELETLLIQPSLSDKGI